MWLLWLSVNRLVELSILAVCLFVVPENRTETVVAVAAAMLWLRSVHQSLSAEVLSRQRTKFILQLLRLSFARLDQGAGRISYADLEADFERLQGEVGIGNPVVLSAKYEHLRKPVSIGTMRLEIEQTWFDSLPMLQRTNQYWTAETVFDCGRLLLIGAALFSLF